MAALRCKSTAAAFAPFQQSVMILRRAGGSAIARRDRDSAIEAGAARAWEAAWRCSF